MADKTISVEITGDASGLQAAVGQAQSALSNLEGSNKSASTSTQKNSSEIEKNTSAVGKNTSASKEAAAAKDNQTKSTQKNETATKTSTTAVDKNTEAVKKNSKETETAQKKQVSFSEKATESGRRWKEAGEGIDQMTKPLQRAAIATAAAGVASAKAAIDFEDNFANVKKTVEGTPEQLEAVKQGIIDMTTVGVNGHNAIPQTTAQLTELAAAGGQLGITTDNIIDFTEVMAQMGTATNLAGEEGAATLARFMNVTNTDQSKIRNLGSSIVDLGNNFATTEAEIASLALRMGETGGVIGISAQDILGYSTALSSMGIQAEAGGSAVSRIWMTMQKAVAGGDESLEKFAKVSGKSSKEFADQWKNDASGAFQDFIKGLSESEDQISTLDELGFGNIRDIAALQALASTKGIELMTDALERSNKAWEENTALQTEADAKAQTTAGQLAITKNNVVETARSLGEVMLPTITDVSAGVRTFAQNLNEMSDSGKKAVITAGAVTVGLGVLAKGTAGTIKTVGTITEGVGKFAKLAPTLASAVPYAAAAAAGITAVTLAVKAGQKIWYDSKFNWGDGFSEQAEKIAESAEALEELNSLAQETENLKLVINSPDSSPEQIEAAKSRLKEIAELLNQEYKLNIDTSDVDTAADKIENAIKTITNQERSELITDSRDLITDIYDKSDRYSDAVKNLPQMENELNLLKEKKQTYNDILSQMDLLNSKYEAGIVSNEEYNTQWDALLDKAEALGLDRQKGYTAVQQAYDAADKAIVKLTEDTDNLKNSRDELEASVNSATESLSKVLASDLLTGNTEGAQDTIDIFRELGEAVKETGASTDNIARQFATAKQGFTDFNEAIEAGAAGAMANDFIAYKESINDCGIEAVTTAAAIKNGFANIGSAASAGALAVVAEQANELAHSMGLIPEEKHIVINAQGDVSVIEDVKAAVDSVNANGQVKLQVSATGDISVLDSADEKLKELIANNQVTITFNVDTGGFDINDLDGNKLGEITAEGKITWVSNEVEEPEIPDAEGKVNYETGETPETVPDASGNANFGLGNHPGTVPDASGNANFGLGNHPGTVPDASGNANFSLGEHPTKAPDIYGTAHYKVVYDSVQSAIKPGAAYPWANKATGDSYFKGGLAMVNDQKGIADPRELIIDNGNAFIPDGRDVILPLSKGAKVYTASQTKRIMEGLGMPHYATGKDNSDEFTAAAESWAHYSKTHPVSASGELQQWLDFQKQYIENAEDIKVIEEEIFLKSKEAYDEQMAVSAKWIEHEEKYNALSYEGKVDAIKRVEEKVQKAYDKGLITEREYLDTMQEWDEEYLDSFMEMIDKKRGESADYIALRTLKNDWDEVGDDPFEAYSRVKEREQWMLETTGDWETYYSNMSELSDDMLDDMVSQTKEALELQQKYFGLSAKEYLDGVDEMIAKAEEFYDKLDVSEAKRAEMDKELYTARLDAQRAIYDEYIKYADSYYNIRETFDDWDEVGDSKVQYYTTRLMNLKKMYEEGVIGPQDYMDNTVNEYLNMYRAVSEEYDDKLQAYQDKMSQISSDYSDMRSKLTSEYEQETRTADLDEVNRLLDIYKNAVTDSGQQKYQDLLDQKKQLLYQQELADLEADEKAELDDIQALYDTTEQEKKRVLSKMRADTYGISSGIDELAENTFDTAQLTAAFSQATVDYAKAVAGPSGLLNELISSVNKISSKIGTSSSSSMTYNNNGSYTFQIANDTQALIKKLTGTIASGLGSVMIGGF